MNKKTEIVNYELDPDPETAANLVKPKLDEISSSMCMAKWLWTSVHLTNGTTNSCFLPPIHKIEVENISEFSQALDAGAKRILLDNFSNTDLEKAVALNNGQVELEASGNVNLQTIKAIAGTGVNFISCGQITKDIKAIDLSLQFST